MEDNKDKKIRVTDSESFIAKAKLKHGDKYRYDKTVYVDSKTKVTITCPKHGDFTQYPANHLRGDGCKECYNERRGDLHRKTAEQFIENARKVHGDKYDYSKVVYTRAKDDVIIGCPIHGDFPQSPNHHLSGEGCPDCAQERRSDSSRSNTVEFIEKARAVHGDRYEYDHVVYVRCHDDVMITCPKHGDFPQTPHLHLSGGGCPHCVNSLLEDEVMVYLQTHGFVFTMKQGWDWLVYKSKQSVDFFIPQFKMAIECQGPQHFGPVELFDRTDPFELRWARDENKDKLCQEHGIRIYYFSNMRKTYRNYKYPYQVFEDMDELMKFAMEPRLGYPDYVG